MPHTVRMSNEPTIRFRRFTRLHMTLAVLGGTPFLLVAAILWLAIIENPAQPAKLYETAVLTSIGGMLISVVLILVMQTQNAILDSDGDGAFGPAPTSDAGTAGNTAAPIAGANAGTDGTTEMD